LEQVQRLAIAAQGGDQDAFGELVKMYHARVYGLMYRMVGNAEDAKELEQMSWVKAWNRLSSYKREARFYTWLYRVASNTAMDFLRQRSRRQMVELNDDVRAEPAPGVERAFSVTASPDEHVVQDEVREAFKKALDGLTPEHKTALILREVEGQSYKEIAEAMKCRVGTVMSRIFYARKTIQQKLKGLR
jgi:RNA polymerase sigma-70 factor (ECF subfamily)